jgi:hypothetical protein
MFNLKLLNAVEEFTDLMLPLSEKDLEHEWRWKDHDEEGIRFAFFVTLQELRQLAVTLSTPSTTLGTKPTPVQHILRQYHAAYMVSPRKMLNAPLLRENGLYEESMLIYWERRSTLQSLSATHWKNTAPGHGLRKECPTKMKIGWRE